MQATRILFLGPFALEPKGTVSARMIPIALELEHRGYDVYILLPPHDNPAHSGQRRKIGKGIVVENLHLPFVRGIFGDVWLAWKLSRRILELKPSIVHLFKPKGHGALAAEMIAWTRRGSPKWVVDTDDLEGTGGMNDFRPYSRLYKRMFAGQERRLLRRAAGVTVASRLLGDFAKQMGAESSGITYAPNGQSLVLFEKTSPEHARRTIGIPEAPTILLYTRFFELPINVVAAALKVIFEKDSKVQLGVAGKGEGGAEEKFWNALRQNGVLTRAHAIGWVPAERLPAVLSAADIAIYPFEENERNASKSPAKLTELMKAGVAIVASRVGEIPGYLENAGILVDNQPEAFASAVLSLLGDDARRADLGSKAQLRITREFSWSRVTSQIEEAYQRALSR